MKHSLRIKAVFAALIFLFFHSLVASASDEIFTSQVVLDEQVKQLPEPAQQKLQEFKQDIAKNSYQNTLKMCEGYRRTLGKGPVKYHGEWKYSEAEALGVWAKVYKEGLLTFFSGIAGKKSTWNEQRLYPHELAETQGLSRINSVLTEVAHSFFLSAYTIYFINSTGFAMGAMHCLEVSDDRYLSREMNYFIYTVLAMDMAGALTSEIITGIAIKKLLATVVGRFILWPFKKALQLLRIKSVQATLGLWVGLYLPLYIRDLQKKQDMVLQSNNQLQEMINSQESLTSESDRELYISVLSNSYLPFHKAFVEDQIRHEGQAICLAVLLSEKMARSSQTTLPTYYSDQEIESCRDLYQDFLENVKKTWSQEFVYYIETMDDSLESQAFQVLRRVFFPGVKKIYPIHF